MAKHWRDSVPHVINARVLSREVKLGGIAACLKLKNKVWVELIVNESKKLKGKTKSNYIGVAEEGNFETARLMLGLLISVIELVDEGAVTKDEVLAGKTW